MSTEGWVYAGASEIKSTTQNTHIPKELFDTDVLDFDTNLSWMFEFESGFVVVATDTLDDDSVRHIDRTSLVQSRMEPLWAVIPYELISDIEIDSNTDQAGTVPEEVAFAPGQRLHWVYNPKLYDENTKWCYVLTDDQLMGMIGSI